MATRSEYSVHAALEVLAVGLPLMTKEELGDEEPILKGELDDVLLGGVSILFISFRVQPLAQTANHPALLPTIDGRD